MVVCKFFRQGNCRYGQGCRFEHIYDSKYSYRAPQEDTTRSNQHVFNTTTSSKQASSASAFFRNAVQNTSTYLDNLSSHMSVQNQPSKPSVFERLGPQPSNVFRNQNNQGNQASAIFSQANRSVFGQQSSISQLHNQTSNVFHTHNQSPNVFHTHNQSPNVFHTHNQSPNVFQIPNTFQVQNQSNAKSLFAQATQSLFGQQEPLNSNIGTVQNKFTSYNNSNSGNVFQITNTPTSNVFGMNSVFEQNQNDDDIYSKLEDLSKSDIEAYESEYFKLGFLPELPPPRALCNVVC